MSRMRSGVVWNRAASIASTSDSPAFAPSAAVIFARSRAMRKNSFDWSGPVPTPTSDHCFSTCARMYARTQYAAYVMKRNPRSGSNRRTASSRPMFPSSTRSATANPYPRYPLAILMTKRRCDLTSVCAARVSPRRRQRRASLTSVSRSSGANF